ncbi:MAG: hypothetical protein R6U98_27800 [Pirellulaceae bacterium]
MESCPTQAVLSLVGLAAEKVIRDRYNADDGGLLRQRVCFLLRMAKEIRFLRLERCPARSVLPLVGFAVDHSLCE